MDWLEVLTAARSAHAKGCVTRLWFPEAREPLFSFDNGVNAEVLMGNPAYQLSSGEIVAL